MNDKQLEALKLSIKEMGMDPIVVCREMDDGSLQLVGGYHTWTVWKQMGGTHIWVRNLGRGVEDKVAKQWGLQHNVHGENVPIDLARVIVSLEDEGITLQSIAKRMGQPLSVMEEVKELIDLDPAAKELREQLDRPNIVHVTFYTDPEPKDRAELMVRELTMKAEEMGARQIKTDIKLNKAKETVAIVDFGFTQPQHDIVMQAIEMVMDQEECNKNRALELICADYIAGMQPSKEKKK